MLKSVDIIQNKICFCKTRYILSFIIIIVNLQTNVDSKAQYVQPLMMGMQVAIPYDIANIWNRPVSLSPFISTFLGLSLLYILFFGVITSPFGYMFGVPSQKYVMGIDGEGSIFSAVLQAAEQWHNYSLSNTMQDENIPRSMKSLATPILRKIIQYQWETPEFGNSVFSLFPDNVVDDVACQQLILCHAHSVLGSVPGLSMQTFRVFTKILLNVEEHHRKAIKTGLDKTRNCNDIFQDCPSNISSLVARILLESLPEWFRKSLILPQFKY